MKRLGLATLAVLMLASVLSAGGQPAAKKLAVPKQDAQDRAAALIDELFGESLGKAKAERDERLKLARTFLFEARETNDDPAGKYVLLRHSSRLAAEAGDALGALEAIQEIGLSFDISAAALMRSRVQMLKTASEATAAADAYQGIVDSALVLLEEAVEADDFESAVQLGQTAEFAAKKLKSVPLVSAIRNRSEAVKAAQAEYALVKPFVDKLQKDPTDAKANLEAGKYYAVFKGNWEKGLPLLAKGSDANLKKLAALDLGEPTAWEQMSQIASAWSKQAGQLKGQASTHALLRAYHWLQRALGQPGLPDKERVQIELNMLSINAQLPLQQQVGEIAVEVRRLNGHDGPVFGVSISGDGSKVASCGADATVRLWDAKSGKELRRFVGHSGPVWTVKLSPDGRQVLSGGFDKSIRLWDPASGRESRRFAGHEDYVRAVAFSGSGQFILSGGDDRLVKLWDQVTGSELKTLRGHDHFVFGVAISRDGKRGLSASLDRKVRLWDLESGNTLFELAGHTDTVLGVVFTPDGRRALSASSDKTLRLWDLKTGETLRVFKGHTGYVLSVAVSPDGRRAISSGQDGKVILWDVDQGKLLRVLEGHSGPVWSVAFSADGRFAATAGNDGSVRVWGSAK